MSGLVGSGLDRSARLATIKGSPGRAIADAAKAELPGGDAEKRRKRARRNASPLTRDPLAIN
ncbi:hypothetical protein LCGC14_1093040 [marine sediment metagenome]|uniref:Uncharacterized protein n=1 Tax=marine sediment metagenome TaxID=412755 RepID=A0A0F9PUY7_9ZZZZ